MIKNKKTPKKKAWDAFSRYIRTRDCLKSTGDRNRGACVTCGRVFDFKKLQAGHFIPGRVNSILFDEQCVHAQCLTKESNLRMFNGGYKSIEKIEVGDNLWAFNKDSFEREVSVVESVYSFIPDELYEIELEDGSSFFATADHQIVVNKKWMRVDELLHNVSAYDILEL